MKKRLTSLFLAVLILAGLLPTMALAAATEEEALGEVDIYNSGQTLSYFSVNGWVQSFTYAYKIQNCFWCITTGIHQIQRTVVAINVIIQTQRLGDIAPVAILLRKPANHRIIIPRPEIVAAGLAIIVAEGVAVGGVRLPLVTKGVIAISMLDITRGVGEVHHIAVGVVEVEVLIAADERTIQIAATEIVS